MADTKISALPASTTPLAGTEVLPIVQSSVTKQVSVANLTAGRAVAASSLTVNGGTANTKLNVNTTTYTAVTNGEQVLIEGSSVWQQGLAFSMWTAGSFNSNYASGYIGVPNSSNQLYISGGAAVVDNTSSGGWAKALNTTSASFMVVGGGSTTFYGNTGLTANTTFTPSVLMSLTTTGLAVTGTLSATGTLSGGTSGTAYSFSGSAPATSLTLDSSGNLGINTTSVDSRLEINSNSSNTARIRIKLNDTPFCYFGGYSGIAGSGNADDLALYAWTGKQLMFGTNASEKMRIDTSGIVTMNAYGAGAATFSSAGVISSVSDETWKVKDGVPTDPDAMLKKLEPGYWYYNDEKKETFGADRQLGFYAQNVNSAIGPEAAPTPQEGKPWGYYDRSVLAITVMSLQKALATIETLTARITALETA